MKNDEKLNEMIAQYKHDCASLAYDFACKLLDEVKDEDVLKLYKDNSNVFAVISSRDKEEILEDVELINKAIEILIEFLRNRPISEEEFEELSALDQLDYVSHLIDMHDFKLYDLVKYLTNR